MMRGLVCFKVMYRGGRLLKTQGFCCAVIVYSYRGNRMKTRVFHTPSLHEHSRKFLFINMKISESIYYKNDAYI